MKSIEKLRAAGRNMAKGRNLENHEECNLLLVIADEIEAEIEAEYVKLPVDADGVPIRMGNTVYNERWKDGRSVYEVCFTDNEGTRIYDENGDWALASVCYHVKPRTLEDVLEELEGLRGYGNSTYEDVVTRSAELAAEIRELIGGDA